MSTTHRSTAGPTGPTAPTGAATTTASRTSRSLRWLPATAAAAAVGIIAVRDPGTAGSYGFCPLQQLTGLDCPFCGGLRGTHELLHGDLVAALDHNLLLPLYLGVLVFVVAAASREATSRRFAEWRTGRGRLVAWLLVVLVLVFFVLRNLPWFPYLDARA